MRSFKVIATPSTDNELDRELIAKALENVRVGEIIASEIAKAKDERHILVQDCLSKGDSVKDKTSTDLVKSILAWNDDTLNSLVEIRKLDLQNMCASSNVSISGLRDEDALTRILFKELMAESGRLNQVEASWETSLKHLEEVQAEKAILQAQLEELERECNQAVAIRRTVRDNLTRLTDAMRARDEAHHARMRPIHNEVQALEARESSLRIRSTERVEALAKNQIESMVCSRVEDERARAKEIMKKLRDGHQTKIGQMEAEVKRKLEYHTRTVIKDTGCRTQRELNLVKRELAQMEYLVESEKEAVRAAREAVEARKYLRQQVRNAVHTKVQHNEDPICEVEVARARDTLRQILIDYPSLAALTPGVAALDTIDPYKKEQCIAKAMEHFVTSSVVPHIELPCSTLVTAYETTLRQMRLVLMPDDDE